MSQTRSETRYVHCDGCDKFLGAIRDGEADVPGAGGTVPERYKSGNVSVVVGDNMDVCPDCAETALLYALAQVRAIKGA